MHTIYPIFGDFDMRALPIVFAIIAWIPTCSANNAFKNLVGLVAQASDVIGKINNDDNRGAYPIYQQNQNERYTYFPNQNIYNPGYGKATGRAYNQINSQNRAKFRDSVDSGYGRNISQPTLSYVNNGYGITSQNRVGRQNFIQNNNIVAAEDFFKGNPTKWCSLDKTGRFVAIATQNDLTIQDLTGNNASNSFAEKYSGILSMAFLNNGYLMYVCAGQNGFLRLISVDHQRSKSRYEVQLPKRLVNIKIVGEFDNPISYSYDGEKYYLHSIELNTGRVRLIESNNFPLEVVSDNHTQTIIFHPKGFGNQIAPVKLFNGRNIVQIDSIRSNTRYVGLHDNTAYKTIQNVEQIQIFQRDISKKLDQLMGEFVCDSGDMSFKSNAKGVISFVTIKTDRKEHIVLDQNAQNIIDNINNLLQNQNWERVDMSDDGSIWLISVDAPTSLRRWVIYDVSENDIIYEIQNDALRILNCPFVDCIPVKIPRRFIAPGHTRFFNGYYFPSTIENAPLIIVTRMKDEHFSLEFNWLAQFLCNRGYNVLCINQNTSQRTWGQDNTSPLEYDLMDAIAWASSDSQDKTEANIYAVNQKDILLFAQAEDADNLCNFYQHYCHSLGGMIIHSGKFRMPRNVEICRQQSAMPLLFLCDNNMNVSLFRSISNCPQISVFSTNTISNLQWAGRVIDKFCAKVYNTTVARSSVSFFSNTTCRTILDNLGLLRL